MRKRVLSVLLVIALLVAVGIIAAQADTTYTPEQIVSLSAQQRFAGTDPVEAICYACGETVTWNPISKYKHATTDGHYLTSGHYFLDEDLNGATDSDIIVNGANGDPVCLQLNGKKITNTLNGSCAILYWSGSSALNVMGGGDCQNTSTWATLTVRQNVPVNIYGGSFKNNGSNQRAISVENGTVTLYDVNAGESVIYTAAGTTNIYSGSYKTLLAGAGAVTVNGAPAIGTVDFTNAGTVRPTYGVLEDGASIGFGSYNGVISAAYASPEAAAAAAAAFPVKAGLMLTVTDKNELSLGPKVYTPATTVEEVISKSYLQSFKGSEPVADYCYACNQNVTWQPISAYVNGAYGHYLSAAGHYFLDKDLAQTNDSDVIFNGANSGNTICLHLNGKTISNKNASGSAILYWSGTSPVNIMGSGVCENSSTWSTLKVNAAVTVNVYGGSYTNKGSNQYAISLEKAGQLNLYGVNASKTLYAAAGTTTVKSGSYEKILVGAGQLSLNGAPVVDDLDISSAATKPTYGVLENGASIGFGSYQGVISSAYNTPTEAQAAAAAFPVSAGAEVIVNPDNTLSIKNKVYTPEEIATESAKQRFEGTDPVKAFCYVCGTNATWEPVTGATYKGGSGHYFVADSYTTASDHGFYTWGAAGTICLHLNGKTITAQGGGLAAVSSYSAQITLNVMGGGTLESGATNIGALYCHTGTATNVYGANLINNGGNNRSVYVEVAGAANLYNVTTSGNVYAPKGSIKIASGSCGKLIVGADATAVTLSGAPIIGGLDISAATVMPDLTGVTGGRINIGEIEGVFTTEFEDADKAAAVAAFVASDTKAIVVDGKKLSAVEAKVAIVAANGQKAYANYAEAEAAYTDGYIKMFVDNDIVVTKNVTIDLNGQHIDASGSGTLTVLDSKTYKAYDVAPGSLMITDGDVVAVAPAAETVDDVVSGYLAVTDVDIITFTYFEMKLSGVSLKAKKAENNVGLYYMGTWSFNNNLPAGKVDAGVVVNVNAVPTENFKTDNNNGWYAQDVAKITNGTPVASVLVDGIMKKELQPAANSTRGNADIHAAAFITVGEQVIMTGVKSMSICDVLTAIENDEDAYAANETKLANFYEVWAPLANIADWNLPKFGKQA